MSNSLSNVLITPGRGWLRFTYGRTDMTLLGVVQIGMQIGALAQLPSGEYAQVNGDFVEVLDTAHVAPALRWAGLSAPPAPVPARPTEVTIKKRRRIAMPTDA